MSQIETAIKHANCDVTKDTKPVNEFHSKLTQSLES